MKVIAIASRKGGTGKTETCRALAAGLTKKGYKVLVVDTDAQRNLSQSMQADESKPTLFDVLEDTAGISDAIQTTKQGDLIQADELLYSVKGIKIDTIKNLIRPLKQYDFILFDTAPALTQLTASVMTATDGIIITSQADYHSLASLKGIADETKSLKVKIYGILITRYQNNRISKDMAESIKTIAGLIGTRTFEKPIRECVSVKESVIENKSIFDYAKRCNAASDYQSFVDEFLALV